jgi:hypothetical protein
MAPLQSGDGLWSQAGNVSRFHVPPDRNHDSQMPPTLLAKYKISRLYYVHQKYEINCTFTRRPISANNLKH